MAKKKANRSDMYANKFFGSVTETAVDTLTFNEIPTNVNVMSKEAWILHRLEWYLTPGDIGQFNADADSLKLALTSSSNMDDLTLDNPGVIDLLETTINAVGAAADFERVDMPLIRDFSSLPGMGLIITPRPLFIAAVGSNLTNPTSPQVRGFFTRIELTPDEYIEMVDFYRIIG